MSNKLKILLADDHPIMRQGLRFLIDKELENVELYEASDGEEAKQIIDNNDISMVVLDINMPKLSGLELARILYKEKPELKIIFLTMYDDEEIFNEALGVGIKGYVLKENAITDIINCINDVKENKFYISPKISNYLIKREISKRDSGNSNSGLQSLTKSERKILKLISQNKTSKEIADGLCISPKTVENHRANISKKLNLQGSHSLVKYAIENKTIL